MVYNISVLFYRMYLKGSPGTLRAVYIIIMEKKSRAFILSAAAVVAALVSIAVRVILTLTSLDVKYGVYKRGSVLPTVCHIILALVCLAFIAVPLVKRKKLGVPQIPKVGDLTVFASCISAFLIAADIIILVMNIVTKKASADAIGILTIVFGLGSVLYFLANVKSGDRSPAAMTIASFFPTAFMATDLINTYFDTSLLTTSPGKTMHELALLAGMVYFLSESRFQLGRTSAALFYASAPVAVVMLLTATIPELLFPSKLLIGNTDSYLVRAAEAAIGLYVLSRMFSSARTGVMAPEEAKPETAEAKTE